MIAIVKLALLMPNFALIRQDFIEMQENNVIFWPILKLRTKNQVHVLWIANMDIFSKSFIVKECIYARCMALPSLVEIHQDLGAQFLRNGDFQSDTLQHSNVAKCQPHFGLWR